MRILTNKYDLPDAVFQSLKNDDYDRGECDYTITELISPPRVLALKRKHDVEIDVSDLIPAFEGKILHKVLENANRTGLVEKRFFAKVGKHLISAQIDSLAWDDLEPTTLTDWKRCPSFKLNKVDPDWELQLNGQHYILAKNGIEATGLQIVAFGKDHSKVEAYANKNYPKRAISRIKIPMWGIKRTEAMLRERIALHESAKEELPLCTDDERYKRWNRRLSGIYPLKCMFYCDIAKHCDQYQNELKKEQPNEV